MFETLFGAETPLLAKFVFYLVVVICAFLAAAWVFRRFVGERFGAAPARARQPRLAVIDSAAVDPRRRLVLIRRDNVEHLLLIGGPTDVVVEGNIVRAAAREASQPARPPAATDTLPRAVPLGEAGLWPLQPEGATRAARAGAAAADEPEQWPPESEQPPSPPSRRPPRSVDTLAGLAAELSRSPEPSRPHPADLGAAAFMPREPARQREPRGNREPSWEREPPMREHEPPFESEPLRIRELLRERAAPVEREPTRERAPAREREAAPMREPAQMDEPAQMQEPVQKREPPPPAPAAQSSFDPEADQNLADMAQRLEAALRRPAKVSDARPPDPASRAMAAELDAQRASQAQPRNPSAEPSEPGGPHPDPRGPGKSVYDSLEKEMASLLGRPGAKP